jgi:KaiC/GvpD/RAD55 family RecA-like ATPase
MGVILGLSHSGKNIGLESRVLRKIFELNRDEVTEEWRKLHNEEQLNDLHCSPNIIRVIKSRRMRWAEHVARIRGEERCLQDLNG